MMRWLHCCSVNRCCGHNPRQSRSHGSGRGVKRSARGGDRSEMRSHVRMKLSADEKMAANAALDIPTFFKSCSRSGSRP